MNFDITPLGEKLFKEYMDEWRQEIIEQGLRKGLEEGFKVGMEQGLERGMEIGQKIAISKFILKNPSWTARQLAESFNITIAQAKKIRASTPK